MKIIRGNLKWAARFAAILLAAFLADTLVVLFARRPLPWVAIIPGFIPVLVSVFVIIPMIRAEKKEHS
jgi:hypothetical protein